MVKYVVDVARGIAAGLWGANYYPGRGREGCVEYTSLINTRPALRWRELAGAVYLEPDESLHRALFRVLLQLTPASARQLPYLLPG